MWRMNWDLTNVLLVISNKSKMNCVLLVNIKKVHIVGLGSFDQF